MTNKYYKYENFHLWDDAHWKTKSLSPLYNLIQKLGELGSIKPREYDKKLDIAPGTPLSSFPFYTKKTHNLELPEVVEYWDKKNVIFGCWSLGGVRWLVVAPKNCHDDHTKKMKTLVTYHQEDYFDPYWEMKVMEDYDAYCRFVSEEQETILLFFITQGPEKGGYSVEITQEASVRFPIDKDRVFLNVELFTKSGSKIKDVEGYVYTDDSGNPVADPDALVAPFATLGVPALDITGRWASGYSLNRKQILVEDYSSTEYDLDRMLHSVTAERMMAGIALEHEFESVEAPGLAGYWDNRGVRYETHFTGGERWVTLVPKSAFEEDVKLPVLVVMQEVGSANDHLGVTAQSYYYQACRLAAQGECVTLFFVLEDPESNELLLDILKEAEAMYPVDMSRFYITGHSHNGMYSLEFVRKHPKMVAAIATMGNGPGFFGANGFVPGADSTDDKLEAFRREDVPLINLAGTCEHNLYYPVNGAHDTYREGNTVGYRSDIPERLESWRRRLYSHNCPLRTDEEIMATAESPDCATRKLGIPNDKSYTLYLDGVEHYVAEIKNNDGKYHLCVVGIENLPHLPTSSMLDLAWSYMRRFKRDLETGEVIELY